MTIPYGINISFKFNMLSNNLAIYAYVPNFEIWIRLRENADLCEIKLNLNSSYSLEKHSKLKELWEQLQWE